MIVDDDVYIAQLFHEALSENIDGISVFSFNDPIMAFEHFLKNRENCALVISDLRMPEESNSYMIEEVINSTIEKLSQ